MPYLWAIPSIHTLEEVDYIVINRLKERAHERFCIDYHQWCTIEWEQTSNLDIFNVRSLRARLREDKFNVPLKGVFTFNSVHCGYFLEVEVGEETISAMARSPRVSDDFFLLISEYPAYSFFSVNSFFSNLDQYLLSPSVRNDVSILEAKLYRISFAPFDTASIV